MSCRHSLEILDAIRPDSNDMLEPEFREAYAHMQECPECSEVWESRQNLDSSLSRVMLDVPVPETLRGRLEESLGMTLGEAKPETESETLPETSVTIPVRPRQTRRRLLLKMSTVLATTLLVTFAAWLFWKPQPVEALLLDDLVNMTPLDVAEFEELSDFDGSFGYELPKIWKKSEGIVFHKPPKGFFLTDGKTKSQKHVAALYRFEVENRHRQKIVGYLLVIPKSDLEDPPELTAFDPDQNCYVRGEMFKRVAWSQGDFTYVAFVPTGQDGLEAIQKALPDSRA